MLGNFLPSCFVLFLWSYVFSFTITHTLSVVGPTIHEPETYATTEEYYSDPYFASGPMTNVTTQVGTHAFLPCKVMQLGNKSVSWIRKRDSHILTVDRYTFIADERFQILHNGDSWTLQVKYVQSRDEGLYECQVTTEPKMTLFVILHVVVPQTKILGESDIFVKSGSTVHIKCLISHCLEQPSFIFWYHESNRVLNDPGKPHWVDRSNGDTIVGTLTIKSAEKYDAGNYTCAPSGLDSTSVLLHVLNGEHPAAIQQGSSTILSPVTLIKMMATGFFLHAYSIFWQ